MRLSSINDKLFDLQYARIILIFIFLLQITGCSKPNIREFKQMPVPEDAHVFSQTLGKTGGIFIQSEAGELATLNPLVASDASSGAAIGLLLGALTSYDWVKGEVIPGLAKSWDIGKDQKTYKVGCIGLHPAVPRYNGFYMVGGYASIYSLEYKKKFREVIEKELEKIPLLKNKFDYWGNRCYLFSSELYGKWNHKDKIISKYNSFSINKLDFNIEKLKKLSCNYILSTVEINNYTENSLSFERAFELNDLPYRIYLYKII